MKFRAAKLNLFWFIESDKTVTFYLFYSECLPNSRITFQTSSKAQGSSSRNQYTSLTAVQSRIEKVLASRLIVEFLKVAQAVAVGFFIMGFIGYVVKLIHIPINNIIMGA